MFLLKSFNTVLPKHLRTVYSMRCFGLPILPHKLFSLLAWSSQHNPFLHIMKSPFAVYKHPIKEPLPKTIVQKLIYEGCKERDILLLFKTRKNLKHSERCWNDAINFLKMYGIHGQSILYIIASFPKILSNKIQYYTNTMEALRSLGFGEGKLQTLVKQHPIILDFPSREISVRLGQLSSLFTTKDNINLCLTSPNVLTDDWSTIQEKYNYVLKEMNQEPAAILKTRLFSYSMEHIRCRHLFVKRLGLFTSPDKHGASPTPNPTLSQIFDTVDKTFAVKIADMPLEDFQTFCDMVKIEEQMTDDSGESGDDSE